MKEICNKVVFLRLPERVYKDLILEAGSKRELPKMIRNKLLVNPLHNEGLVIT